MNIFLVESVEVCQRTDVFLKEGRFWNLSIIVLNQFSPPSWHQLKVLLLLCNDSRFLMCGFCVSGTRSTHLMRQKRQTTERSFSKCLFPSHFHSTPVFSVMTCLCSTCLLRSVSQHKHADWKTPMCGITDTLFCFVSLWLALYNLNIFRCWLSQRFHFLLCCCI